VSVEGLHARTEGDRRTGTHSWYCQRGRCNEGPCRCWCHGITKHLNGARRPDALGTAARSRHQARKAEGPVPGTGKRPKPRVEEPLPSPRGPERAEGQRPGAAEGRE
jgi:hypothetical protein